MNRGNIVDKLICIGLLISAIIVGYIYIINNVG